MGALSTVAAGESVSFFVLRFTLCFLLTALVPWQSLHSQTRIEREALKAYRDSLSRLARPSHIKAAEQTVRGDTDRNGTAFHFLRLGFARLERARLEAGNFFDDAKDAFVRAREMQPSWPLPLLGIGLADRGKGDWLAGEKANLGTRVGHGAYRSALRALMVAVEEDPQLTEAMLVMNQVASELRDTALTTKVLEAHRRVVGLGNKDPEVLLAQGRLERAIGSSAASVELLRHYGETGRNVSLAQLELARTLLIDGSPEGPALYFQTAESDDSATVAELRADLLSLATEEKLKHFDNTRGAERKNFLYDFWQRRARLDLRDTDERLQEHFRRLRFASRHFALGNNRRYYGLRDVYRAPAGEVLDDRGVVYVRHGEPGKRLRPVLYGLLPSETWLYHRADGDLLLHFSGGGEGYEGGDLTDYRVVSSATELRGEGISMDMLYHKLAEVSDVYEKLMSWGPHGVGRLLHQEREWGRESAIVGTSTEGYALQFADSLPVMTDLMTIGISDGKPLLHLLFALSSDSVDQPTRVRMVLFDSLRMIQSWIDTTVVPVRLGLNSGARVVVPVPSGTWKYRLAIQRGQAGVVSPTGTVQVPELGRQPLSISQIGLGRQKNNVMWVVAPGDTAMLHPDTSYPLQAELQLYYEIYRKDGDRALPTTVTIYERSGSRVGRNRQRLRFTDHSRGEITRIRRSIRLLGLQAGEYWVEISVNDGENQAVTRKSFTITPVTQ